jgi:hypothetical protein
MLSPTTRRSLPLRPVALALAATLSCSMVAGASDAVATTQAQKLSRALKACKKQPKRKRAACVKRAKKQYARHPTVTSPTGPATTPTGPATTPTGPTTPTIPTTTPAGPVAPAGPTLADLQQLENAKGLGDGQPVQSLTILDSGTPQQGTGTTQQVGGNGQPTDVWIYPEHVSYDWTSQLYDAHAMTYTETTQERERDNVLRYPTGQFALRFQGSSETCDPTPTACTTSSGGGA